MRLIKAGPAVAATLALTAPSAAEAGSCGTATIPNGVQAFAINVSGTTCRVARDVVGRYDGPTVRDARGRRWRCRITRYATGTDPGYYPYTHVRCSRPSKAIRFKLRS